MIANADAPNSSINQQMWLMIVLAFIFMRKKQLIKQRFQLKDKLCTSHLLEQFQISNGLKPMTTKSIDRHKLLLHHLLEKDSMKFPNSVIIVQMVQILVTSEKNELIQSTPNDSGTVESMEQSEQLTNDAVIVSNGTSVSNGDTASIVLEDAISDLSGNVLGNTSRITNEDTARNIPNTSISSHLAANSENQVTTVRWSTSTSTNFSASSSKSTKAHSIKLVKPLLLVK